MAAKTWGPTTLGQEVDLLTGFPFKSAMYTDDEGSIRLLRGDNIIQGKLRWDGVKRWPTSEVDGVADYLLKPGDIVVAMDRPWIEAGLKFACLCEHDLPCLLVQRVARLRAKPTLDQRFLRYIIGSAYFTDHVLGVQTGTAVPHISAGQIREFRFLCPPLPVQQNIGGILSAFDDKIELNRRMNETLEAMARALFNSWFVDFDPVRAKAEGREPAGMSLDTARVFPSAFVDSTVGRVPKGWSVKPLPEAIHVNPARPLAKGAVAPYLEMGNMPTSSARPLGWELREAGSGMKFVNGDTLLARITPCLENGKTAFVDFLADGQVGWGSTEYIVLRSKPPLPPEYAYFLARSDDLRAHAIQNMTGTSGRQRVPAECFNSYPVVVPSEPVARRFGEWAGGVLRTMRAHDEQSATLATIRAALLPKLLAGEIRVQEAERAVGREA